MFQLLPAFPLDTVAAVATSVQSSRLGNGARNRNDAAVWFRVFAGPKTLRWRAPSTMIVTAVMGLAAFSNSRLRNKRNGVADHRAYDPPALSYIAGFGHFRTEACGP